MLTTTVFAVQVTHQREHRLNHLAGQGSPSTRALGNAGMGMVSALQPAPS